MSGQTVFRVFISNLERNTKLLLICSDSYHKARGRAIPGGTENAVTSTE